MGKIIGRYIAPHPAILIPAIGRGQEKRALATAAGMEAIARDIAAKQPATIIVISPHAPSFADHFYLNEYERVSGDFSDFGNRKLLLGFPNDMALARRIALAAQNAGLSAGFVGDKMLRQHGLKVDLDHGVTVPLSFVCRQYEGFRVLPVSVSGCDAEDHYRYGQIIAQEIAAGSDDVAIIASGDLSHKLREDGPYGFHADGPVFDALVEQSLRDGDGLPLLDIDPGLRERAAQCGLDSFYILLGTMEGLAFQAEVFSHEGPFGVGYLTAALRCDGTAADSLLQAFRTQAAARQAAIRARESEPVGLARRAIDHYLRTGEELPLPADCGEEWRQGQGGVFVSLKKNGQLRGCIGTTMATQPTLAEEIITNAVSAAVADDRFHPVQAGELDALTISVDVLGPAEEVADVSALDPKRYGVIVESGRRRGLLLPDLDGIETAEEQLRAVRDKAGIHPWHRPRILRFEVKRYH